MITSKKELKYYLEEDAKQYEHRLKKPNSLFGRLYNFIYRHFDSVFLFQKRLRYIEYYDYKMNNVPHLLYYTILYYTVGITGSTKS